MFTTEYDCSKNRRNVTTVGLCFADHSPDDGCGTMGVISTMVSVRLSGCRSKKVAGKVAENGSRGLFGVINF